MKKLSIKANLMLQFLVVGIVPLALITVVALYQVREATFVKEYNRLDGIRDIRIAAIKNVFKTLENQTLSVGESKATLAAAEKFTRDFNRLKTDGMYTEAQIADMRMDLINIYNSQVRKLYLDKNPGKPFTYSERLKTMHANAVIAQHAYLYQNPNPFGSKRNLVRAKDGSQYSETHAEYHEFFRNFLTKFGFYDLFIIDSKTANIVYSVTKEIDFAKNLSAGTFATSSLGDAFKAVRHSVDGDYIFFADYESYAPSYGAPGGFVATPIVKDGKNIAVLAVQMDTSIITNMLNERHALGETGESILIGKDMHMRSDARHDKNLTLEASFLKPETGKVDNLTHVEQAFAGKNGHGETVDYVGDPVLSSFGLVKYRNIEWAILVEKDVDESLSSLYQLIYMIGGIALGTVVLIVIGGIYFGRALSNPILKVAESLSVNSEKVAGASDVMQDSSQKLSEMAGEQACSIEETAASIEEISAMVKNNVDQAEKSSTLSSQVKDLAGQGNSSMDQLIQSMNEIMESNRKIQELVKVIEEIGDKTEVIDEIVFQTKLLSFNASVEAERAGEHGRGFAVVAQEVGNLAQMSGKAALEIASMVKSSIKNAEQITNEAKRKVESGNELVKETAKYLKSIQGNAEDLSQQAAQIVVSSKEQSDGISQVNEAMSHLDQATQQNSATAEATEVSSKGLGEQAQVLERNVKQLMKIVYGKSNKAQELAAEAAEHDGTVVQMTDFKSEKSSAPSAMPSPAKAVANGGSVAAGGDDSWEKL